MIRQCVVCGVDFEHKAKGGKPITCLEHRLSRSEISKRYRINHPDAARDYKAEYKRKNPVKHREDNRRWHRAAFQKDPEKVRERQRRWRMLNPEAYKRLQIKHNSALSVKRAVDQVMAEEFPSMEQQITGLQDRLSKALARIIELEASHAVSDPQSP